MGPIQRSPLHFAAASHRKIAVFPGGVDIFPALKEGNSYWFHAKAGIPSVGSCHGTKSLPEGAHRVQKFFPLGITNLIPGHYAAATKVAALLRGMEIELLLATFVHAFHNTKN
jgi:hypothetical protein